MALQAGSSVVDITPRTPCHLAGYAGRDHEHESVHDPILLRALYVRGSTADALLISADILWFYTDMIERMCQELQSQLGLSPENVLVCGTHTHSAPTVSRDKVNREWQGMVEKQAVSAAAIARTRLQEAHLKIARGESAIGINRREQKPSGEIILGKNPDGPNDREVIVISVHGADSTPIARICNFACHGVVLGQGNYQLSGDWPGHAATRIEAELNGSAFLFFNGGAANINPRIGPQNAFEPVAELADEFVEDFRNICNNLEDLPQEDVVGGAELELLLPRKLSDIEAGQGKFRQVHIQGLRLGPLYMIGFPGEVFSETTIAVKQTSPHPVTLISSYTAGGHAGYVPVNEAYETGGYEVRVSPYAEGAEPILRQAFLDLLSSLP